MKTNAIKQPHNPDLVVFPLTSRMFDVFHGEGWNNWARYRKSNTRYYRIGGMLSLTPEELDALVLENPDK